eukprot:TRINITY_DN1176_c0_g1_i1.p1 TRINITY_DN1176_c0_g1~~TRINITY_DN1176_c0_g1_i1.p1  ORF type:complete len:406 (+),score=77.11 TRINITY_DN1176_c0_g1_i1:24-1220(+)
MAGIKKFDYKYIVVGCGGLGSAALYWLSRTEGANVLGIEQFEIAHHNGGSQDHSRIIRLSYDHDAYTKIAPHMYTAWKAVEDESGIQLVVKCGAFVWGPKDGGEVQSYINAMNKNGIPFTTFNPQQAKERFPQFNLKSDDIAVYQADGGLVDPRKANATHIALAKAHGAAVIDNTKVIKAEPIGKTGVKITTNKGIFTGEKLIIASGAWTNDILKGFGLELPLYVKQEQVTYFDTPKLREFSPERFPVWIGYTSDHSNFYGFPVYGEVATKAGEDMGGNIVTADTRDFKPNEKVIDRLCDFVKDRIPNYGTRDRILYTKTCLYTLTPDRHFIIDTLPDFPQVSVTIGAGHAYKWASLIGLILSQLAIEGKSTYPIDFFSVKRNEVWSKTKHLHKPSKL